MKPHCSRIHQLFRWLLLLSVSFVVFTTADMNKLASFTLYLLQYIQSMDTTLNVNCLSHNKAKIAFPFIYH